MAKNAKPEKDSKKSKKDKGEAAKGPSVAAHPRARAHVRRAKGWGGLAAFIVAAYVSLQAGVPFAQAGLRAIGAGACGYLVAWGCAVTVWRHLVMAELRAAAEARRRRLEAETVPAKKTAPAPAHS
jgi:hypothetical protein